MLPIFKLFWAKKTQWTHDSRRVCARAPAHIYTYLYRDQFWLHFAWTEIMAMMWICNNVHQAKYEVAHLLFFVHVKNKDILLTTVWMHLRSDLHAIDVYIYKLIDIWCAVCTRRSIQIINFTRNEFTLMGFSLVFQRPAHSILSLICGLQCSHSEFA